MRTTAITLIIVATLWLWFFAIACTVFQFRNPKANQLTFIRHFFEIHRFEKLETYQP